MADHMKAISVRDPWATLIASGRKTVELRTWTTRYRGPLLICASATPDREWMRAHPGLEPIAPGHAICVVDLVGIHPATQTDSALAGGAPVTEGRHYAWELANARAIPPRPVKGRLGLYDVEVDRG